MIFPFGATATAPRGLIRGGTLMSVPLISSTTTTTTPQSLMISMMAGT